MEVEKKGGGMAVESNNNEDIEKSISSGAEDFVSFNGEVFFFFQMETFLNTIFVKFLDKFKECQQ